MQWPKELLEKILAQALDCGYAKVACASKREARLLRYALYNYRTGEERSLQISVDGNELVVLLPATPQVTIRNPT